MVKTTKTTFFLSFPAKIASNDFHIVTRTTGIMRSSVTSGGTFYIMAGRLKHISKSTLPLLLSISLLFGTSCRKKTAENADPFEKITLGENRTWTNEDPKYEDLIKTLRVGSIDKSSYKGSYLIANDDAVLFLYCEDALEIDGKTSVNPYTTYDSGIYFARKSPESKHFYLPESTIRLADRIKTWSKRFLILSHRGYPVLFEQETPLFGDTSEAKVGPKPYFLRFDPIKPLKKSD